VGGFNLFFLTTYRLHTAGVLLCFGFVGFLIMNPATGEVDTPPAVCPHDINNPLTYVQLTAHRLDRTLAARVPPEVAATVRDQLADIRHGLERIAAITARLRSLSRADEPAPAAEPAPPPSPAPAEPARHRVLVIDDEPLVRGVLAKLLADTHAVTPCASGPDGLALLATARFDVILCDVMMPGMNGRDVYRRIAAEFPGLERRVVFISGGAFAPDLEAFLDTLPNAKIAKPFRLDEVLAIVERVANSPSR
jgi:CheY-like chemotaxis protein